MRSKEVLKITSAAKYLAVQEIITNFAPSKLKQKIIKI